MSHWSVSRPLTSAILSILDPLRDCLGYYFVAPSHEEPAAFGSALFQVLRQITDGVDVETSQPKALELGVEGS